MTWEQRLLRARRSRVFGFTLVDKRKVSGWPTCAIGEKFHLKSAYLPDDASTEMTSLGFEFMSAVQGDRVYDAIELYNQIQHLEEKP